MNKKIFNRIVLLFILVLTVCSIAYPESAGQLIIKAKDHYDNRRYSKARDDALEVIKKDANLLEGHKIYIKSCSKLNEKIPTEMDKCINFYKDTSSRMMFYDRNKPVFLFGLGFACLQKEKNKEAEEAFNQSMRLNPKAQYVKDIQEIGRKYKLKLETPARSLAEDIQLWSFVIVSIVLLFILWFAYKGYSERKIGEQQVAKIKKDRSIDFFGRKRY